jgi:hypothetical protein
MTLQEAHSLSLKVLKQVMEEKLDENNVQLAQVGGRRLHPRTRPAQLQGTTTTSCSKLWVFWTPR